MLHRHLAHQRLTLAAIDDVIARGKRQDWTGIACPPTPSTAADWAAVKATRVRHSILIFDRIVGA